MNHNKTYILKGTPIPQARPRFATRTGRAFNKQKKLMDAYRWELKTQQPTMLPDVPLKLTATFFMPFPQEKRMKAKYEHQHYHMNRGDLDNLVKMALDVVQGILISDDKLISVIEAEKIYDEHPRTEFTIKEL